eukprot:6184905-Pleurochrysis_carterae.AAC.1
MPVTARDAGQTGCRSCWDILGTNANRLASVICCHERFCVPLRVLNDFASHKGQILISALTGKRYFSPPQC